MPKVRRSSSLSADRSRKSPYPCTSGDSEPFNLKNSSATKENIKEWEEARCPICMEYPHNVVLLKCSSHEKGCRPYMCNTSYRHSNCLDQFCKSSVPWCSTTMLQELPLTFTTPHSASVGQLSPRQTSPCGIEMQSKPLCPLCRGELYGYVVVEAARHYMNSEVRNCSSETCEYSGTYSELRKHARSEHPFVRPSEVDPTRYRDWVRLEQESDWQDVLSLVQPGDDNVDTSSGNLDAVISIFSIMIRSLGGFFDNHWDTSSGSSSDHSSGGEQVRNRGPLSGREHIDRRRSQRMSRVRYYNRTFPSRSNLSSEVNGRAPISGSSTSRSRGLRWRAPNNDVETSRAPRWSHSSLSWENAHVPSRNNFSSEMNGHAPRRENYSLQEESSRGLRWGNNSLPEEIGRTTRWGNNSLPEEASRVPRWGNTSLPESLPRQRGLRWRNQRWPTYNSRR